MKPKTKYLIEIAERLSEPLFELLLAYGRGMVAALGESKNKKKRSSNA